jgi:hypothetical protein
MKRLYLSIIVVCLLCSCAQHAQVQQQSVSITTNKTVYTKPSGTDRTVFGKGFKLSYKSTNWKKMDRTSQLFKDLEESAKKEMDTVHEALFIPFSTACILTTYQYDATMELTAVHDLIAKRCKRNNATISTVDYRYANSVQVLVHDINTTVSGIEARLIVCSFNTPKGLVKVIVVGTQEDFRVNGNIIKETLSGIEIK